jgi:hypothetical protein
MSRSALFLLVLATGTLTRAPVASADAFGSGVNAFQIDFVPIGDPNNVADTTGSPNPAGSVPYSYRIGKFEISEQMIDKANALGGLGITKDTRGPDKPVTSVTWFEAAQFVNWLNTSTGHTQAYKFDAGGAFQLWLPSDPGYDVANLFRNTQAKYFLPGANEWYKAAFFNPAVGVYYDYPTGGNAAPTGVANGALADTAVIMQDLSAGPANITQAGGLSPYGTMAQGGNVGEWDETEFDLTNDDPMALRGGRGGMWDASSSALSSIFRSGGSPSIGNLGKGFRVASGIPEPAAARLFVVAMWGGLRARSRRIKRA